jgi:Na+/melibiose symporter-like transporter
VDVPLDPFIGAVMDKTRSPLGRYRLWMLIGTPFLMWGLYQLFNPPMGASEGYLFTWLLVYYAGSSMFVLGHSAWAAALATNYHERSRVYGWMQGIGVFGSVSLLMLPVLTAGKIVPGQGDSMTTIGWIVILSLPVTVMIVALLTPERLSRDVKTEKMTLKDYAGIVFRPSMLRLIIADLCFVLGPGMTGPIYIFFFHDAKGFTVAETGLLLIPYIGAGLVGAPFWAAVARKIGKHRTVQIGAVAYAIAQTTLMILPRVWPGHTIVQSLPTILGMFAVGFCASCFVLMVRAMVADVADEMRLDKGRERTGMLYSMITLTQKVGAAITTAIAFGILAWVGYNAEDDAVNTKDAIFGLEMVYLFAPMVFVMIGAALFFGYNLDSKRHAEIRDALEARDAAERLQSPATIEDAVVVPAQVDRPRD